MIRRLVHRALERVSARFVRDDWDQLPRTYTIPDHQDGSPYLTRTVFKSFDRAGVKIRPMLHRIHRADTARTWHNHPWKWAVSIILLGSYTEERLVGGVNRTRRVRFFNKLTDADFHYISQLHGNVWTLFVTGPRVQDWGFLVDGAFMPKDEYFAKVLKGYKTESSASAERN